MINKTPLFLLDIELDSGTEYVSDRQVTGAAHVYEPFVISWGTFETSIPNPPGMPIVGDGKFTITEPQSMRKWRDLFSHQTPRRRPVKLWALFEGESLTYRQPNTSPPELRVPFFQGEIADALFNADRSIDITCRNQIYAWKDEPIPAMITKDIYPGLPERYEGQFLPIVVGQVRTPLSSASSPPSSPPGVSMNLRGQIALPRMGWNDVTGDRWGVAAHPCARVVLFRKVDLAVGAETSASPNLNTEEWEHVDPGEYQEIIVHKVAYNISMYHHLVDFFVEQPDGTEIRADIDGYDYRGPWGTLPEIGTFESPPSITTSPPSAALRNPIDFFINMMYFVLKKAGLNSEDVFDTADIGALHAKFETLGLMCDGAITEPITCNEWLQQFFTSFNIDMWQKRNNKISLNFTDATDPGRLVYTETDLILKNTFTERLPEKPINQFQYRYQYNFAEKKWGTWGLLDTSEQQVLAIGLEPKVEKEVVDEYFVRDPYTAFFVTTARSQFLSLGSYVQEWQIPLPEVPIALEPSVLVGITHRMGLEIGGYVNREAKVLKLRHAINQLKDGLITTVTSILREPQTVTNVSPS